MDTSPFTLYQMPPALYDSYISTQIERRNFEQVWKTVVAHKSPEQTRILDLCCGTGNFATNWLSKCREIEYTGVDINGSFLEYAQAHVPAHYKFIQANAVTVDCGGLFDIVLATSGYHHISDDKKRDFLSNAKRHMLDPAVLILYEKFVEPFHDLCSQVQSGTHFYAERIYDMVKSEQLTQEQLFALFNEMFLTAVRMDEFKVPLSHFRDDVTSVGLHIDDVVKLWPSDNPFTDDAGDFVITLKKE